MNNILITLKKELKLIIRDKKSLLMMAITPLFIPIIELIFLFPANMYCIFFTFDVSKFGPKSNSEIILKMYEQGLTKSPCGTISTSTFKKRI